MVPDYYETLGVAEDASPEEMRKVFRKKARELHPDVSQEEDAENKFKKVNEAYSVLSDPDKRREYDLKRKGIPSFGGGGFPGFGDAFSFFHGAPFRQAQSPRPRPIELRYDLPVYSALVGGKIKLQYKYKVSCPVCEATGVSEWSVCEVCGGVGFMQHAQGAVFMQRTCPACGGFGKKPKEYCKECMGSKFFDKEDTAEISVPPGFNTSVFTMEGKGHEISGIRGPLIVGVVVNIPDMSGLSVEDKETLKGLVGA